MLPSLATPFPPRPPSVAPGLTPTAGHGSAPSRCTTTPEPPALRTPLGRRRPASGDGGWPDLIISHPQFGWVWVSVGSGGGLADVGDGATRAAAAGDGRPRRAGGAARRGVVLAIPVRSGLVEGRDRVVPGAHEIGRAHD